MTRARAWLFNTIVVIGAVAVGLTLSEIGLRLFYPQPMGVWLQNRNGLAGHWPGLVTYLPQFGMSVSFNSAGMRDREHAIEKPRGVFRILVLGDSFMEAMQLPFESTFPSLLERGLVEKTRQNVEVVNASVSGWGTDDELEYLTTDGMKWKPDLVIVAMTLHNDISDNLREQFHAVKNGALVEQPRIPPSFFDYKIIQFRGYVATRLHTYQLLVRAKRARETQGEARRLEAHVTSLFKDPPDDRTAKGFELTSLLIQRMATVTAEGGGRLVVVLLPLAVQLSDAGFTQFAQDRIVTARGLEIDRPQRVTKESTRRLGIEAIDLLPGFREWTASGGRPLYLERDGHWNEAGHRLAANIVISELMRRRLLAGDAGTSLHAVERTWRADG